MAASRTNVTADGNYDINYNGGEAYFSLEGTLGGGTYTLQVSQDETNWTNSDVSLTAAGGQRFSVGNNHSVRLNVSGSTTPDAYFSVDLISQSRTI
jgi:hypothetical protein